jgi:hypothetical protein
MQNFLKTTTITIRTFFALLEKKIKKFPTLLSTRIGTRDMPKGSIGVPGIG